MNGRVLASDAGADRFPTPLLFISGIEKRWITDAPADWRTLDADRLIRLLSQAREFPAWVGSFLGHFDE